MSSSQKQRWILIIAFLFFVPIFVADAADTRFQLRITGDQCFDGIDNDSDGFTDFPDDPECDNISDDSERDPLCSDGIDNDGDGLIDFPNDPQCSSADDETEDAPQCSDTLDNDTDGLTDYPDDPGCSSADDDNEVDEEEPSNPPSGGGYGGPPTGDDDRPVPPGLGGDNPGNSGNPNSNQSQSPFEPILDIADTITDIINQADDDQIDRDRDNTPEGTTIVVEDNQDVFDIYIEPVLTADIFDEEDVRPQPLRYLLLLFHVNVIMLILFGIRRLIGLLTS